MYTDSAAFSQKLLGSLADDNGTALLPRDAARFWTEHSDRAGLDSWAAALGVQKSERDFLGRWSPEGSTDAYVRTTLRVVENVQLLAAHHARLAFNGGPDFFGEEHLLKKFSNFLVDRGWECAEAEKVARGMDCADYARPVPPTNFARGWSLAEPDCEKGWPEAPPAPGGDQALEPDLLQALEDKEQEMAKPAVEPWGFVVSITRGGRHRKLHHVGSCKQQPGVDYRDFQVYGDVMPPNSELDSLCGRCFGSTALPAEDLSEAESCDSSSSSRSGKGPAKKKAKTVVKIE